MDHEKASRLPLHDGLGHAYQPRKNILEGSLVAHGANHQITMKGSQGGVGHSEAKPNDDAKTKPMPIATLMLQHRQQPLPFILPQPLGPLPAPAQHAAAMVPTVRRDLLPASFPANEYQMDPSRAVPAHIGPTMGSGMRQQAFAFPLPPPDLTRRQSIGSPSGRTPPYLPPPLSAYPRRSTSPAFRPGHQPQVPPLSANSGGLPRSHAPNFWPSSTSSSPLSPPAPQGSSTPGVPFTGPPRSLSRAAEHVRYQCDQCPENFSTNGILKRHKKTHLARKYQCGCGAAYTDKSVLRVSLQQ